MKNNLANSISDVRVIFMTMVSTVLITVSSIIFIRPLIIGENAYRKVEGEIVSSHQTSMQYRIRLNTSKDIYNINGSDNDIFSEKVPVGGNAIIWYERVRPHKTNRGYTGLIIRKMIVNDEIVIPFHKGIGMNIIFMSIITLFLIGCTIDVAKKSVKKNNIFE